ncbi:MAG: FKBP-type peptidyl-prolyl cis-trans isomerase [Chitinophagales bacterium]
MKYNPRLASLFAAMIVIAGCGKLDYKKTKTGLLYKIISTKDSKGPEARTGNVLKLYFQQKLNDSVLQTNYGKMPAYQPIDASLLNSDYSPTEIFTMLHKGDSAVTVMLIDSLILKGKMPSLPPFMKRGDRIVFNFKVADLFTSDSLGRLDNTKEMKIAQEQELKEMAGESVKENKEIEDYLASNKIKAQKTPKGAYVEVINAGSGMQADSGKFVSLKYRGTTFAGKTFDTNMDSSFHHIEPLQFAVGSGTMMPGFDEGVRLLRKGGKARIYVPAVLGNGASPVMQGGKPYQNLIFEVELLDVKEKPVTPKMSLPKFDTTKRKK